MNTPTTAATETLTPSARADAIAEREGGKWAAQMLGECRFEGEKENLIESTTVESLSGQDFTALKIELNSAGLLEQWETRERELCTAMCRAALDALEAAEV